MFTIGQEKSQHVSFYISGESAPLTFDGLFLWDLCTTINSGEEKIAIKYERAETE